MRLAPSPIPRPRQSTAQESQPPKLVNCSHHREDDCRCYPFPAELSFGATTAKSAWSTGPRMRQAGDSDVEALTRLINAAFVVERVVFDSDRVDTLGVRAYMQKG